MNFYLLTFFTFACCAFSSFSHFLEDFSNCLAVNFKRDDDKFYKLGYINLVHPHKHSL